MNYIRDTRTRKRGQVPFSGFTLFEVILALALGSALLALIGAAINLYLVRVDADRARVEEAQLARSVLAMICNDIRNTTVYQKQDTSAIAQLMAAGTPFDVDTIDKAREATGGSTGGTGGVGALAKLASSGGGSSGSSGSKSSGGSSSGSSTSSSSASSSTNANSEGEDTMPLGLTGIQDRISIDVTRIPGHEELFATKTGYTNAPSAATGNPGGGGSSAASAEVNPPADVKTVCYYVRQGNMAEPGSPAATGLDPAGQASIGGLVRQNQSRRERLFGEQSGSGGAMSAPEVLIAPEVTQIEFHYYCGGTQLVTEWDMKEQKKLPMAIEVCIGLRSSRPGANAAGATHMYRQVVCVQMAAASQSAAATDAASAANASTDGTSSSTSGSNTSPTESAFGDQ